MADSTHNSRRLAAGVALTLLAIAAAGAAARLLVAAGYPSPETLSLLFVIPVLGSAVLYGFWLSLAAAVTAVLAYNFFLLPPLRHIALSDPENAAKLVVLVIVAAVASTLSARNRRLAREAQQRERILVGVHALSQDMLGIVDVGEMKAAAEAKLSALLGYTAEIILRSADQELLAPAAEQALVIRAPTGAGTRHFADNANFYIPILNRDQPLGVIKTAAEVSAAFPLKVLATLAAQVASALDKARLAEAHQKEVRDAQREAFLSALLSSVSHDFKTPLVTVIGALSSLKAAPMIQADSSAREIVAGGLEEARKLDRYISNLVEIGRLESGLEAIRREPVSLRDVAARALKSLHPLIGQHRFVIEDGPDFPLLLVNPALMDMVLLNLLENAIKYGPPAGEVKIIARWDGRNATIDVDDDGAGIPPEEREAIFVKFYRAKHGDRKVAGTGLGLYICRAIVAAHGGSIAAIDPNDGQGACVRITLPAEAVLPVKLDTEAEEAADS